MLKNLCNDILKEDITVIASRPANGKVQVILNVIHELGIKQQKKMILFGIGNPTSFYIEKLVSLISGIEDTEIKCYFRPCKSFGKTFKIKEKPFIEAIETLGNSNITMCDFSVANLSIDILDYILSYDEEKNIDVIIIDSLEDIEKKSEYGMSKILEKLKKYALKYHTHFIILSNVGRIAETRKKQLLKDINNYEMLKKYADIIMLTYRLKERDMYSNHLKIQIDKNNKQETYQVSYNIKTNQIERNETNE